MANRIDYLDDPDAPSANTIVPSANVVVTNEAGDILLMHYLAAPWTQARR